MGDIVWSRETILHNEENLGRHDTVVKRKRTIFSAPDKVAGVESDLHSGLNHITGDRYWRWQNMTVTGMRRNHKGTLLPYYTHFAKGQYGMQGRWMHGSPGNVFAVLRDPIRRLNISDGYIEEFTNEIGKTFGVREVKDVYPIAGMYDLPGYDSIPKELVSGFRNDNFKDFVTQVFGKTQVRKDLVKASAGVSPFVVSYARQFRGLVPVDWIVNFMRLQAEDNRGFDGRLDLSCIRSVLREMDPRSYRHLLSRPITNHEFYQMREWWLGARQGRPPVTLNGQLYRNWTDAHDVAFPVRQWNTATYEPPKNEPIELVPTAARLHEYKEGDYKIVCATETDDLQKWSNEMRNCISGYTRQAATGHGIYGAVYEGQKFIANFEIRGRHHWTLGQLLGKANTPLSDERRRAVEKIMTDHGVDVPKDYWGAHRAAF